jgi:hypothetical protein
LIPQTVGSIDIETFTLAIASTFKTLVLSRLQVLPEPVRLCVRRSVLARAGMLLPNLANLKQCTHRAFRPCCPHRSFAIWLYRSFSRSASLFPSLCPFKLPSFLPSRSHTEACSFLDTAGTRGAGRIFHNPCAGKLRAHCQRLVRSCLLLGLDSRRRSSIDWEVGFVVFAL